jgi:hypothetical protein
VIGPHLLAPLLAASVITATASAAAGPSPSQLDLQAKRVSDTFVQALVVKHDLARAARFASPHFGDLQRLSADFVREGVDTIVGQSRIVRGCRVRSLDRPSSRGDCVFYRLRGSRRTNASERVSDGAFKVWLRREAAAWKVWAYEYSGSVTVCAGRCQR